MKRWSEWRKKSFLHLEFMLACVVSAAFFYWCESMSGYAKMNVLLAGNRGAVYGAFASVLGALLGFAITSFSILLTFSVTPQMEQVRDTEQYPALWKAYKSGVRWLAIATTIALLCLILDKDISPNRWAMYALVFTTVTSAVRVYRVVWVLEQVTNILTAPSKQRSAIEPPRLAA